MSASAATRHRPRPELRELDLGSTALSYACWPGDDDAQPIIFLHPWFGCWQFWSAIADALDATCYAIDLYSLGRGSWSEWSDPDGLARAVTELADAADLQRVTVVGNSVGGIVAQALAAAQPERIADLVLVGTGPTTEAAMPEFRARVQTWIDGPRQHGDRLRSEVENVLRMLIVDPVAPVDWNTYIDAVCVADRGFFAAVLRGATQLDLRPRLERIAARTLIVRGELDVARSAENVRQLQAGIGDSVAMELPRRGHCPMVEDPAGFTELLTTFAEQDVRT